MKKESLMWERELCVIMMGESVKVGCYNNGKGGGGGEQQYSGS